MIPQLYKCFQHWSDGGSVYLYSDTHFGDKELQSAFFNRPSDERQLENMIRKCRKNDTLILLGDVGEPEYLKCINSYKVLIMGNHDQSIQKYGLYFDEIYAGPLMIGNKLLLSHEPVEIDWAVNVCGHVHSPFANLPKNVFCINPDYNGYYEPISLGELIKRGLLQRANDIHRITIDNATLRKEMRE